MIRNLLVALNVTASIACSGPVPAPGAASAYLPTYTEVDSARVLADLYFLSSPALEGRAAGTAGNRAARAYIEAEMIAAGLRPFPGGWLHRFELASEPGAPPVRAANVVGFVEGTERPDRYIVLTAHFDHLGIRGDQIYHGADDNASGTAALLEMARYFAANPPRNSLIFAALDAEERGLQGARALVAAPPVPIEAMLLNVNLDMVGRNAAGELYMAGSFHYPSLTTIVETVAERADLTLLRGHDRPTLPGSDDWTMLSDHGAFHAAGVPFAYFGVEDHPDYHRPTDTFERIDPGFFVRAVRTVLDFVEEADSRADEIAAAGR